MVGRIIVEAGMATFVVSSLFLGPTGFDSSKVGVVSMSGVGMITRNQTFRTTIGESNFALAA